MRPDLLRHLAAPVLVGTLAFGAPTTRARAQDLPTDAQLQAVFGAAYNRLGLMQYCAAKKLATTADVANMRRSVDATVAGMTVSPAARAQQAAGQHGDIVGKQVIGLMDPQNPAHPELVQEGRTVSLAENARAQHASERTLCRQMAAQVAPIR